MKLKWLFVFSMSVLMHLSAAALEPKCTEGSSVATHSSRQERSVKPCSLTKTQESSGSPHDDANSDNGNDGRIVVNVWSSAPSEDKSKEEEITKLSPAFTVAGLTAAAKMQNTERRLEQSIKQGFPLGEFWILLDFDSINDSLRLASLSVRNDADRQALEQLQSQVGRLRLWSDWLIEQNRELRLADYYITPSTLDNDERFQSSVGCTDFLLSMLASGKLQEEDRACR